MAPEVMTMEGPMPYSPQSDVWSFGIVLFELFAGELPYKHLKHKDQVSFI